jgi:hypothetical protein
MRASVTLMGTRHRQPHFSAGIKGRTRLIYLGEERVETARRYVANCRRLAELVDQATLLHTRLPKSTPVRMSKRPSTPPPRLPPLGTVRELPLLRRSGDEPGGRQTTVKLRGRGEALNYLSCSAGLVGCLTEV